MQKRMILPLLVLFIDAINGAHSQPQQQPQQHQQQPILPLSGAAFCQPYNYGARNSEDSPYPMAAPDAHIPWVWDAVYNPLTSIVDINTIFRGTCHFNQTFWQSIVKRYPRYKDKLSNGDKRNIITDAPYMGKHYYTDLVSGLIGSSLECRYHLHGKITHMLPSLPIDTHYRSIVNKARFVFRCPAPDPSLVPWDSMSIARDTKQLAGTDHIDLRINASAAFPVCIIPKEQLLQRQRKEYQYQLSVCTVTGRGNRAQMVEWIEYSLLQGIEHFFIYNSATSQKQQQQLKSSLQDFINEGIVTLVPWPYSNCVNGMSSGRALTLPSKDRRYFGSRHFMPPAPIGQKTAFSSCYSRFRHTSKYMAYIDDDEFLLSREKTIKQYIDHTFERNPKAPAVYFIPVWLGSCPYAAGNMTVEKSIHHRQSGSNRSTGNSTRSSKRHRSSSRSSKHDSSHSKHGRRHTLDHRVLATRAEFRKNIAQVEVTQNSNNNSTTTTTTNPITTPTTIATDRISTHAAAELVTQYNALMPRLSRHHLAEHGIRVEGKLILRTDAVVMFRTHKLTQLTAEPNGALGAWSAADLYTPSLHDAMLLHYKAQYHVTKDIFGQRIPIRESRVNSEFCNKQLFITDPKAEHVPQNIVPFNDSNRHRRVREVPTLRLDTAVRDVFVRNYKSRMQQL